MRKKHAKEIRLGVTLGLKFRKDCEERKKDLYEHIEKYAGLPGVTSLILINGEQRNAQHHHYLFKCSNSSLLALNAFNQTTNKELNESSK